MKTHSHLVKRATLAGLLLGLAPLVSAEIAAENRPGQNPPPSNTGPSRDQDRLRQGLEDPRGRPASELIGMEVQGKGGESLGKIDDFVIDAHSGKIAYAIVTSGGLLGINATLRAVPVEALRHNVDRFSIDLEESRWSQAPIFAKDQVPTLTQEARGKQIHDFYGQQAGKRMPADASRFILVSDIRGKEVHNGPDQVGEIDEVIVRFASHSTAARLDPHDDFVGTDRQFLVPIRQLQGFERDNLRTNLGRDDFTRVAPMAQEGLAENDATWGTTLANWGYAAGNALERGAEQAGNSAERAGDRIADGVGRTDDATGRAAREPVVGRTARGASLESVRQAVQADARAAGVRDDVQVVARDDKIILRGTVPSEKIKDRLVDTAENAAPGWQVESELNVPPATR
jgi:sporulation protein YlmC with PRC-barrel domain